MQIDVADNPGKSRYEITVDGEPAGFAEYHLHGGELAMIHTQIDPQFGGQGLGGKLARAALDDARSRGFDVLPYCPFIRSWIQRNPDYASLVPEVHRAKFEISG